jgi:UDP-N-acetylmuramoylalanine--D-glutamate ligase
MKNAHVIGLGRSGIAAARLLHRSGWQVILSDRSQSPTLVDQQNQLQQEGITVLLGTSFVPDSRTNLVVVSPGVPWDIPALVTARENGLEVIGEMELAWRFLEDRPWVGVTGTNGKTTTTALTAAIFQAAGLHAPACGNIGYAACELALQDTVPDWVIAELSSYQIEASATLAPKIGIWTTLTPDHLQRHKTLENYWNIKASLLHRAEYAVFNGDDVFLKQHMPELFPKGYWTSIHGKRAIAPLAPATYIEEGWVKFEALPIVPVDALKMTGDHNLQNLLMAVSAACLAELAPEAIAEGVASFPGVPHRLEHICSWHGVNFINDSKATNYDAAEVGLRSVEAPAVLIAGGDPKTGDDTAWLAKIQEKACFVLLIGDAAPQFAQRLKEIGYAAYEIVETMDRAVQRGAELAHQFQAKTMLLSPACASFDQYTDFEQRGEHFRQLCLEYFGKNPAS